MFRNAKILSVDTDSRAYHDPEKKLKRSDPAYVMSSSSLRDFWVCPDRWRTPIVAEDGSVSYCEREETDATWWGNLFDCMVLTPKHFHKVYAVLPPDAPGKPTKKQRGAKKQSPETIESIKWWDGFLKENEGREIISESDLFKVNQAARRFLSYPGNRSFIEGCFKQVWIRGEWHDPETKMVLPVQCLVDLLPDLESEQAIVDPLFGKCAGDVKSTKNAHPMSWEKWAHGVGYDVQAAWNTDLILAAEPRREITSFEFLLCENYPPWQPARESMQNDMLDDNPDLYDVNSGRRQYKKMMADYCKCLKTGIWPDYGMTDEASNGVTICRPNPYAAQARQFAPKFVFEDESDAEKQEQSDDIIL